MALLLKGDINMQTLTQVKIPERFYSASLLSIACTILLQACGGGSSSDMPPPDASPSGVTARGIITAFGSVFVNGVE